VTDRRRARARRPGTVIGVVSDTHGLLRPEALRRLRGVDRIVHAGDIGTPGVLRALEAIAPVTAVRGNNDRGAWARALPETTTLTFLALVFWTFILGPLGAILALPMTMLVKAVLVDVDPANAWLSPLLSGDRHEPEEPDQPDEPEPEPKPGRGPVPEPSG